MALTKQHFTKLWTEAEDFPTVENSEAQVRADMQELHSQMQNYINSVLTEELDEALANRLSADGLTLTAVNGGDGTVTVSLGADGEPVASARLNIGQAQNITNTYITNELYTDYGWIADIVVDWLRTDHCRASRYLEGDTSQLDYLNIHDEEIKCVTALPSEGTEQMCFNGTPYYWTDADKTQMTTEQTEWPVMSYTYSELTKLAIKFESVTLSNGTVTVMPVIILGAGTGVGDAGKAMIYKDADAIRIKYNPSGGGGAVSLSLDDSGQVKKTVGATTGVVEGAKYYGPLTVTGGSWTLDATYAQYPYAASLICTGVSAQMNGEVIFSPSAPLDKLCPVASTGSGIVTVYAKENIGSDVTVELIKAVF